MAFFGPLVAWLATFGIEALAGVVFIFTGWLALALFAGRIVQDRLGQSWGLLAFPIVFVAGEYLRSSYPLGGFGWGALGYSQHDNLAALRVASFSGVWGLSFLLAGINALLAQALIWSRSNRRQAMFACIAAGGLILFPALLPVFEPGGPEAKVALVQGNVPEGTEDPHADDVIVLNNHIRLTRPLKDTKPDLVVWGEGAFDRDPLLDTSFELPLKKVITQTGAPFVVGALRITDLARQEARNEALFFDSSAELKASYAKRKLVPFGEKVPFRPLVEKLSPGLRAKDMTPGTEPTVFSLPNGKFSSVICYESTYPGLVRSMVRHGAQLLVVQTNNSSYGRTAASEQHLAFSQVRAAEHGMWVMHAAVSGISGVVAPTGRLIERSKLFTPDVLSSQIRFADRPTPYGRFGDWVPWSALGASLVLGSAEIIRRFMGRNHTDRANQ